MSYSTYRQSAVCRLPTTAHFKSSLERNEIDGTPVSAYLVRRRARLAVHRFNAVPTIRKTAGEGSMKSPDQKVLARSVDLRNSKAGSESR